jgi:hypothetical protein
VGGGTDMTDMARAFFSLTPSFANDNFVNRGMLFIGYSGLSYVSAVQMNT